MPKKKSSKGGNPNPIQTPEFLAKKFPSAPDVPADVELAEKPLCVKVPVEIDAAVRSLEKPSQWLRKVITDAAKRELLNLD